MGPKKKAGNPGGPKPGTKQAKAAAEIKDKKPAPAVPEEPKKPSVKEVIGGASWTGKLPVNMLSEHCQKQKWEKPEYSMVNNIDLSKWLFKVAKSDFIQMLTTIAINRFVSPVAMYLQ